MQTFAITLCLKSLANTLLSTLFCGMKTFDVAKGITEYLALYKAKGLKVSVFGSEKRANVRFYSDISKIDAKLEGDMCAKLGGTFQNHKKIKGVNRYLHTMDFIYA